MPTHARASFMSSTLTTGYVLGSAVHSLWMKRSMLKDGVLVTLGTLIQVGSGVLALVLGFGIRPVSWAWVGVGFVGVVFGRMAIQAVLKSA